MLSTVIFINLSFCIHFRIFLSITYLVTKRRGVKCKVMRLYRSLTWLPTHMYAVMINGIMRLGTHYAGLKWYPPRYLQWQLRSIVVIVRCYVTVVKADRGRGRADTPSCPANTMTTMITHRVIGYLRVWIFVWLFAIICSVRRAMLSLSTHPLNMNVRVRQRVQRGENRRMNW